MLKTTFSKHLITKTSMIHVYIKPEVKKNDTTAMATAKKIVLGDYKKTARERRARRGGNYIFDRRGCKFDEGNFLVGEINTFLAVGWESLSHLQGVVSALKLIPLPNPNQAIFSDPQVTKIYQVPPGRQKPMAIPICCTCLKITLMLISDEPTNTF